MFHYDFIEDSVIIGGDFNLHHTQWGSEPSKMTISSQTFVETLAHSPWKILNSASKQYTYISPATQSKSHIDLTMISNSLTYNYWYADHANYSPQLSDHIPIYFQIKLQNVYGYDPTKYSWRLNTNKWPKFTKTLKEKLSTQNFDKNPQIK